MKEKLDIFRNNQTVSNLSVLDQAILLFEIQNKYVAELSSNDCIVIANLFKKLKELQEQIPKWHLVADGDLPSEEDYLNSKLCWDEYRERCVFARFCNGTWILGDGKESIKVVAWMELPKFEVE